VSILVASLPSLAKRSAWIIFIFFQLADPAPMAIIGFVIVYIILYTGVDNKKRH
jgi:hypothetical protein